MHINSATIPISPNESVELAGYRPYRGDQTTMECLSPLEANAIYLHDGHQPRLLISFDLIWLSEEFVSHIKKWVFDTYSIPEEAVLLTATHTHSGPNILTRAPFYGKINERYVSYLSDQTQALIQQVMGETHDSHITAHKYPSADLPVVNRITFGFSPLRLRKTCFSAPNPGRYSEEPIRILYFGDATGTSDPHTIIISMACHPVFYKGNQCTPDYPASLRSYFRHIYGSDIPVLFLQGFAGDLRPHYPDHSIKNRIRNTLLKGRFKPDFEKEASHRESQFVQSFENIIENTPPEVIEPASGKSTVYNSQKLPVWNSKPETPELTIQRWDLTGSVSLIAANAEVFSSYSRELQQAARQSGRTIIPVGYANGMLGYLPDQDVLKLQCGYEYKSWHKFGLPGPFPYQTARQFSISLAGMFS